MCGISGITTDDRSLVEQMNAVQKHRGPDYAGIFSDGEGGIRAYSSLNTWRTEPIPAASL